jgi:DNA-binding Lrp family transcriptional regulator
VDELDLALVNAMQMRPRAPWAELAGPLGVDAATLSRRWARLATSGEAWVTCYPGAAGLDVGVIALVEVDCHPGAVAETATVLAGDAHALTVDVMTGGRDLLLDVAARSLAALGDYVTERIGRLPGVAATRTFPVTALVKEGSSWEVDSLDVEQRTALQRGRTDRRGRQPFAELDRRITLALAADGRMALPELSERTGVSVSSLRRRITTMLATGQIVLRADVAHVEAGWPVQVFFWLDVSAAGLDTVVGRLARLPEIRMCALTAGPADLALSVWLHRLSDLPRFEAQLARLPEVRIVDRSVYLRQVKRLGRLLDQQGRSVGHVPIDLWADPVPGRAAPPP